MAIDYTKFRTTDDGTPGGFFDTGQTDFNISGTSTNNADRAASSAAEASVAASNAVAAEADAELAARNSRGWAVGDTDAALDGWDSENNAKYWAEHAQTHGGNSNVYAKVSKSWADGDTDVGTEDNPVYGNDTDNAKYWAMKADSDAVVAGRWAVGDSEGTESPSATNNAQYWANQAKASADAAATSDSEITLGSADSEFTFNGLDSDHFTLNQGHDTEIKLALKTGSVANSKLAHSFITINGHEVDLGGSINVSGGGNVNTGSLSLAASPSELLENAASGAVAVTATASSGFTIDTDTLQWSATDQDGHALTVNDATFPIGQITVDTSNTGNVIVRAHAMLTKTSDSSKADHSAQVTIRVDAEWFIARSATQPTALSDLTSQGAWNNGDSFTGPTGTDETFYAVLPTHTAGYAIKIGPNIYSDVSSSVVTGGAFGSGNTLYSWTGNDIKSGITYHMEEV